jgi:hypothetical protein
MTWSRELAEAADVTACLDGAPEWCREHPVLVTVLCAGLMNRLPLMLAVDNDGDIVITAAAPGALLQAIITNTPPHVVVARLKELNAWLTSLRGDPVQVGGGRAVAFVRTVGEA